MTRNRFLSVFLRVFAAALIVAGIAVIFWPAALITAGLLMLIDLNT